MSDISELANLRDIHMPPPVSSWPPGPAYYLIIAVFMIALLVFFQYKRYQRYHTPKFEALQKLLALKENAQTAVPSQTAAAVNTLLKRVALAYFPRLDVASLYGPAWLAFLKKTSKNIDFDAISVAILETPFNPDSKEDIYPLLIAAHRWIKQRRKRCLN